MKWFKPKKVYCINCDYCESTLLLNGKREYRCNYPDNIIYTIIPASPIHPETKVQTNVRENPSAINADNHCKWFKWYVPSAY
jgi:hypothetical protein